MKPIKLLQSHNLQIISKLLQSHSKPRFHTSSVDMSIYPNSKKSHLTRMVSTVVGRMEVAAPMFPPLARPEPQTPFPAPDQDEHRSGSA
jgi:hypothetical protein